MSHARNVELLRDIGLTEVEARVYICLLREGSLKAGLIAKILGVHRRSVYDAIDRLRKKGLVSYIKMNNVNNYEPTDPKRLLEMVKEREKTLEEVLPELEGLRKLSKEKKETLFFRGKPSLRTVFNDQLEAVDDGDEILILGADVDVDEFLRYYFPNFDKERKKRKISVRMIIDSSAKNGRSIKSLPLSKIKYADFSSDSRVSTYIYGNRVSTVRWDSEPIAILIKEGEIANRFRDYFEVLWSGGVE